MYMKFKSSWELEISNCWWNGSGWKVRRRFWRRREKGRLFSRGETIRYVGLVTVSVHLEGVCCLGGGGESGRGALRRDKTRPALRPRSSLFVRGEGLQSLHPFMLGWVVERLDGEGLVLGLVPDIEGGRGRVSSPRMFFVAERNRLQWRLYFYLMSLSL